MIVLPSSIVPKSITETLITSNDVVTSDINQAQQINASAFHKWSISYEFPPLSKDNEREMRVLLAQVGQTVKAEVIDVNTIIPTGVGAITVASGSSGKLLNITGINAGVALKKGQWVSIVISGQSYLYLLAANSAAGSTARTLNLTSSLRVMPSVGDVVSVAPAYIEGYLSQDSRQLSASVDNGGYYSPRFTITELK